MFLLFINFRPVAVDAINDTIAIMSSSGTTGQCKGKFFTKDLLSFKIIFFRRSLFVACFNDFPDFNVRCNNRR